MSKAKMAKLDHRDRNNPSPCMAARRMSCRVWQRFEAGPDRDTDTQISSEHGDGDSDADTDSDSDTGCTAGQDPAGLLWDDDYDKKPAYYGVMDAFTGR